MEPQQNDYHISFFKPTTDSARRNRNMVVQLVLIWAVAIFGFHILLKLIEKPVPEPAMQKFEAVWPGIAAGSAGQADLQQAAQSILSVLGKVAIDPADRELLNGALSAITWELATPLQQEALKQKLSDFESIASAISDIGDPEYAASKNGLIEMLSPMYGLSARDVRIRIAPLEIHSAQLTSLSLSGVEGIEGTMGLYLIHNQSFLTDTKFLGFPFHYFYSAVFLLILFIGLCWLYCFRTDTFNKKYGIED